MKERYYLLNLISKSSVFNLIVIFTIVAIILAQIVSLVLWHHIFDVDRNEVILLTFVTTLLASIPLLILFAYIIKDVANQNKELQLKQKELNYQKAELSEALGQLREARDMAIEASHAKSRFLANMSHEFRTPLNAIIGYTELILEDIDEENLTPYKNDLEKILFSSKQLVDLINDVLDLTKIEAGKDSFELVKFPVKSMVDEVLSIIHLMAEKNNNTTLVEVAEEVGEMTSDPGKVRRCLINLLSNACKFTENGKIVLKVYTQQKKNEDFLFFEVIDTGIGMMPQEMERIFDYFTQADETTTRKYGGTGLGLTITKKLCSLLGGDIIVTSQKGVGSVFTMYLPVTKKKSLKPSPLFGEEPEHSSSEDTEKSNVTQIAIH
jgi:signal transduction histidine kinase